MDKSRLFIFIILLAGVTLPLFSLNLALVNDYIPKEKFVAAGSWIKYYLWAWGNGWSYNVLYINAFFRS